jgi:hypothetical protein
MRPIKDFLYLLMFILLIGCRNENAGSNAYSPVDSIAVAQHRVNVRKVIFEEHPAFGIIMTENCIVYDENGNESAHLNVKSFKKVQILGKTTEMYNVNHGDDKCAKANFVKVKYNDKVIVLFGKDVFEIDDKSRFPFSDAVGNKFSVFQVNDFVMGARDEDGLTDCGEYSILLVYNEQDDSYSTIGYPSNEVVHNQFDLGKAVLFNDDMAAEKIKNVSVRNDSLIIGIKAVYQEPGSIFNLKSSIKDNFKRSVITDKINYDFYEDMPGGPN